MKTSVFTFAEEASLTIHNIRNSLAVLKLHLEKMNGDCSQVCSLMETDPEVWTSQDIQKTSKTFFEHQKRIGRMLMKMDNTIDIIKHQQGDFRRMITVEAVELNHLIGEIVESTLTTTKKIVKVEYNFDLPNDPLLNRLRVYQILSNSIQNAMEAIERNHDVEEGNLNISCNYHGEDLVIEIHDNGEGLSQADLGRVGEIGFSLKKDGNGLGVYYCRKIVQDECGGTMMVASAGKGKGATFKFRFPGAGK